jgi:hypothetical protein
MTVSSTYSPALDFVDVDAQPTNLHALTGTTKHEKLALLRFMVIFSGKTKTLNTGGRQP